MNCLTPQFNKRTAAAAVALTLMLAVPACGQVEAVRGSPRDLVINYGRIDAAIKEGDTRAGLSLLHQLLLKLEASDDILVPTKDESVRSLKSECMRLVRSMSDDDMRFYEDQFGPEARNQLKQARAANDKELLELVSRRFFFTQAGAVATRELGLRQLDSGQPLSAAMTLGRLLRDARNPARFEPSLSVALATAWAQAGVPDEAKRTLKRLSDSGLDGFETAGDLMSLELMASGSATSSSDDWSLPLGNMQAARESGEVVPVWEPLWQFDPLSTLVVEGSRELKIVNNGFEEAKSEIEASQTIRRRDEWPLVPAPVPLVVGGRVVLRSPLTLNAIRSVDGEGLKAGEVEWETYKPDPAFMEAFREHDQSKMATAGVRHLSNQYAYTDMTSGVCSSNGRFVFAIEESRVNAGGTVPSIRGRSLKLPPNYLRAYDLESGGVAWQIGGERGIQVAGMRNAVFLGAPLPFGDDLLTITASRDEIRLLQIHVLNPESAQPEIKLVWSQRIGRFDAQRGLRESIRLGGLMPAYANGVLVCPTGGEIVALDPTSRSLLWRNQFQQTPAFMSFAPGWLDSTPRIVGDVAICAPRGTDSILCFDLQTGAKRWETRYSRGAYIAVTKKCVIAVGAGRIAAFSIEDGSRFWADSIRLRGIVGRGLLHGNLMSVPLASGVVVTFDWRGGEVTAKSRSPVPLGNLIAAGDQIISQTPGRVVAFAGHRTIVRQIETGLQTNPDDADLLTARGIMRLQRGKTDLALQDFARAAKSSPNSEASEILVSAITSLEGDDLRRNIGLLEGLDEVFNANVAPVTLQGLSSPALTLASTLSGLSRSPKLRLLLADIAIREDIDSDAAVTSVQQLIEFARTTSSSRIVAAPELHVDESRYFSSEVRKLFAEKSRSDRLKLITALETEIESLLGEGELALASEVITWIESGTSSRLIEQLAKGYLDSDPARGIGWYLKLAKSNNPDLSLRSIRTLIPLLVDRRPDIVRNLMDRVRIAAKEHEPSRAAISEWQTGTLAPLVNRVPLFRGEPKVESKYVRVKSEHVVRSRYRQTNGGWSVARRLETLSGRDDRLAERFSLKPGMPTEDEKLRLKRDPYLVQSPTVAVIPRTLSEAVAYDLLGATSEDAVLWRREIRRYTTNSGSYRSSAPPRAVGPIVGDVAYIAQPDQLLACDLRTGRLLWSRQLELWGRAVFADDKTVAIATLAFGGSMELYSAHDGSWLGSRPLQSNATTIAYGRDGQVEARILDPRDVEQEREPAGSPIRFREPAANAPIEFLFRSLCADKVRWRFELPPRSTLSPAEAGFCAVVSPDGVARIIHIETGAIAAEADTKLRGELRSLKLHVTTNRFVLLPDLEEDRRFSFGGSPFPVNGTVVGFDRTTGDLAWETKVVSQQLVLEQTHGGFVAGNVRPGRRVLSPDLPVLALMDRRGKSPKSYQLLDCTTGKLFYERAANEQEPLGAATADPKAGTIGLRIGSDSILLTYPK